MKAIVFAETGGPEVLALADVPKPEVRPGMVLLKTHAIGVNFADTLFRQGRYAVAPKLPDTPGLEAAGVIEAVGDGVTGLRAGMRVAAFASKTYAEYCLAPAAQVIPLPDTVSFIGPAGAGHGAACCAGLRTAPARLVDTSQSRRTNGTASARRRTR